MKFSAALFSLAFLLFGSVLAQDLSAIDPEALATLTDEDRRIEHFRHIERIFPVEWIHRAGPVFEFGEKPEDLGGISFEWSGTSQTLEEFLDKTITTNFLVVKDDAIVFEKYYLGNTRETLATSMSVAKSFTSALVGIALAEGAIGSVRDPIEKYLPEMKGSGYEGVPIEHLLQMSSGIAFSEVYDDETSDIIVLMGLLGGGESIKRYAAGLEALRPSGEVFNYASIDTNVLGLLLESATGKNPARYLEEKIWTKLGMESHATWATDNHGNVLTFAWLNVTARDYAKFGRLYLNKGKWNGKQIVPKKWVNQSVKPNPEYLMLKDLFIPGWDIGYQYKWWVPHGDDGEYTGIGVWGQYLYVNPAKNLIIVKNSVDPDFDIRDRETIAAFRAIGDYLDR